MVAQTMNTCVNGTFIPGQDVLDHDSLVPLVRVRANRVCVVFPFACVLVHLSAVCDFARTVSAKPHVVVVCMMVGAM